MHLTIVNHTSANRKTDKTLKINITWMKHLRVIRNIQNSQKLYKMHLTFNCIENKILLIKFLNHLKP